jgi:hypothetical protein
MMNKKDIKTGLVIYFPSTKLGALTCYNENGTALREIKNIAQISVGKLFVSIYFTVEILLADGEASVNVADNVALTNLIRDRDKNGS